ncbi:MAG: hypothetical protein QHH44_10440 [Candidatus Saccharicenans sp.]|nr:hypothetical protein [Candidatus Saccharicenans sp.]
MEFIPARPFDDEEVKIEEIWYDSIFVIYKKSTGQIQPDCLRAINRYHPIIIWMIYLIHSDIRKSGFQEPCIGQFAYRLQRNTDQSKKMRENMVNEYCVPRFLCSKIDGNRACFLAYAPAAGVSRAVA